MPNGDMLIFEPVLYLPSSTINELNNNILRLIFFDAENTVFGVQKVEDDFGAKK